MRIKSNSSPIRKTAGFRGAVALVFVLMMSVSTGRCEPVESATARTVAESVLRQHVRIYGGWNGSSAPIITDAQAVRYQGVVVAYNFRVAPSGHVLIAVDDVFSPVLLYSTDADFDPGRVDQTGTLESVMIPALQKDVKRLSASRQRHCAIPAAPRDEQARSRIRNAWAALKSISASTSRTIAPRSTADAVSAQSHAGTTTVTVGPLLSTAWSQDNPYNLDTPMVEGGCVHTLTGCVATAWSQVLRYWSWPVQGQGSHSYTWNGQTLSVDFATTYDWTHMPDMLYGTSSDVEKDAVSLLMYQVGVAADMFYGCTSSASNAYADDILPLYFSYKTSIQLYDRAHKDGTGSPYTSAEWLALLTQELDADPPRPVILSLFTANQSGHEAVVDGYQRSVDSVDLVHINLGWSGHYDGFYNITSDFQTDGFLWTADQQDAVIGIEPDNQPPEVSAGGDQTVDESTQVQLNGSATDPEGVGIQSYVWTQTGGPAVSLSDPNSPTPMFTAPSVNAMTELTFQLRATDANRAFATDDCTVAVSNSDNSGGSLSTAPTPALPVASSGGGGGCFIGSLSVFANWQ